MMNMLKLEMNYKYIILGLFVLNTSLFSDVVFAHASATKETKTQACKKALELSRQEALNESGVNIFSKFESKVTIEKKKLKKIIKKNLQLSFGLAKLISKTQKAKYQDNTGMITCRVDAKFDIDTSKLKSQLNALQKKYDNMAEEEKKIQEAISKKNVLIDKYWKLQQRVKKVFMSNYNVKYSCGEDLSWSQCKIRCNDKITMQVKKKLADKYNIDEDSFTINKINQLDEIKVSTSISDNGLTAVFRGNISSTIKSIDNPYKNEINNLDRLINKSKLKSEDISNSDDLAFSNGEKTYKYGYDNDDNYDFDAKNKYDKYITFKLGVGDSDYELSNDFDYDDSASTTLQSLSYYRGLSNKLFLKFSIGEIDSSYSHLVSGMMSIYEDYEETVESKSYSFFAPGVSIFLFGKKSKYILKRKPSFITLDVDYIIPFNEKWTKTTTTYTQPSWFEWEHSVSSQTDTFDYSENAYIRYSVNWMKCDKICFALGLTSNQESNSLVTFSIGGKFK